MAEERVTEPQPTPLESAARALQGLSKALDGGGRRIADLTDVMQEDGLTDEVRGDIGRELRELGPRLASECAWAAAAIDPRLEPGPVSS